MSAPRGSRVVVHGRPTTGFLQVPNALLRDPGLTVGARSAVLWLASQAASRTVYRASGARELGVKPHTFTKYTDEAATTRWLQVEDTGDRDRQGHAVVVFHVNLSEQATRPLPQNGSGSLTQNGSGHCPRTADKKTMEEDQREGALHTPETEQTDRGAETADGLVGAWSERAQPPRELIAPVRLRVASLLGQDISADDVRAGLDVMDAKGLGAHLLPQLVHEARARKRSKQQEQATEYEYAFTENMPVLEAPWGED